MRRSRERRSPTPQLRRGADGKLYIHVPAYQLTLDEAVTLARRLQRTVTDGKVQEYTENGAPS